MPILDPLIDAIDEEVEFRRAKVDDCRDTHKRAQELLRESAIRRTRPQCKLYESGRQFLNRSILGEVQCAPPIFPYRFEEGFAQLRRLAIGLDLDQQNLRLTRVALLRCQEQLNKDNSNAALKAERKRLLDEYRILKNRW